MQDFNVINILFPGILSQNDYLNLVQCETLEDLKLHLQSTDYGNFLSNESTLQVRPPSLLTRVCNVFC